jgi:hypothetical protein
MHSHLNYLSAVWGNLAKKKYVKPLQILQNKAIKHIFLWNYRTPTYCVYAKSKILSFENLKKFNLLKFIYKTKHGLTKSNISPKLNREIHRYQTRNATLYHIDPVRTNFGKYAIINEAIHLFDSLPSNIREKLDYKIYKNVLKTYLLPLQES